MHRIAGGHFLHSCTMAHVGGGVARELAVGERAGAVGDPFGAGLGALAGGMEVRVGRTRLLSRRPAPTGPRARGASRAIYFRFATVALITACDPTLARPLYRARHKPRRSFCAACFPSIVYRTRYIVRRHALPASPALTLGLRKWLG